MIPIGDTARSRSTPYVNIAIIIINIVVFVYEVSLSQDAIRGGFTELDRFIFHWGSIPACTFDALGFDRDLSATGQLRCGAQPQPQWTWLSAMFMHGSFLHIAGNMLFLWIFGDNVEDALGHVLYGVFYVLTGALAALTHGLFNVDDLTPAIGASGAVAGVMGAYIVLFPRARVTVLVPPLLFFPLPLPAWVLIGFWFLLQIVNGAASLGPEAVGAGAGVAYFAHIGGFIAGAVLVNAFAWNRDRARAAVRRWP